MSIAPKFHMHRRGGNGKKKPPLRIASVRRALRELIWPRRWMLCLGLLLISINRLAGLVMPGATRWLVDDVIQKRNLELLQWLALAVGSAVVVQAITSYLLTQTLSKAAQRLIADLRIKVQEHIGRLPVSYYDANKTGALLSRIMNDAEGVRNLVGTGLVELLGGMLTAVAAFIILLTISVQLTLLTLLFLGIFAFIMRKAFSAIRPIFKERSVIQAEVSGRLTESLSGIRIVKGFHAEKREAAAFAGGAMRLFDNVRRSLIAMSLLGMASTLLMGMVSVTVMVLGGRLIIQGHMTLGEFFSYSMYVAFLVAPVFQIVSVGSQITEAFAGLDRIYEVLAETPEDVDPQRHRTLGTIEGNVSFREVTFEYEPGKPVLRDVGFETMAGTVTALVGPSGSGKSTLIGLVAAFAKPQAGVILVDGADLDTIRLDCYRSQLGVVLQDNFLFDGTISENILFGRPAATQEEVLKAARIARVDEFAEKMDKAYDTVVGERGVKLSGGQRQRVAIARAILADPRILILDEATSSLDTESEQLIQEGLAALMRGRTTFVIAHRLSTIRTADQILVLESGRIVERGSHQELMAIQGRYFELYTRQAGFEANRFINPGEHEPPVELETTEAAASDPSVFASAGTLQKLRP